MFWIESAGGQLVTGRHLVVMSHQTFQTAHRPDEHGFVERAVVSHGHTECVLDTGPEGASDAIVIWHGFLASARLMRRLGEMLHDMTGKRVVLLNEPSLRGRVSVRHYSQWLEGVYEHLGLKDVVLIGHSLGGLRALHAVSSLSRYHRAEIHIGGMGHGQHWTPAYGLLFLKSLGPIKEVEALTFEGATGLLRTVKHPLATLKQSSTLRKVDLTRHERRIAHLGIPVLMIAGEHDELALKHFPEQAENLGTTFTLVPGHYHATCVLEPEAMRAEFDAFFRNIYNSPRWDKTRAGKRALATVDAEYPLRPEREPALDSSQTLSELTLDIGAPGSGVA